MVHCGLLVATVAGILPAEVTQLDEVSVRAQRQTELQGMQGIEDTSILQDLAEAEEEYDNPDQVYYTGRSVNY